MISKEEMIKRIDEYFDHTSPEQFDADLKETNCTDMVGIPMQMFTYEVPLGAIGSLKTGDHIDKGIVKEIHFVGMNENKMIITGICDPLKALKAIRE